MGDFETATLTFPIYAGVLVRGGLKRAIRSYCFGRGLTCTVEEDKGMFDSTYYFTITGTQTEIQQASADLNRWMEDWDAE